MLHFVFVIRIRIALHMAPIEMIVMQQTKNEKEKNVFYSKPTDKYQNGKCHR